jgi:hypothetical protein
MSEPGESRDALRGRAVVFVQELWLKTRHLTPDEREARIRSEFDALFSDPEDNGFADEVALWWSVWEGHRLAGKEEGRREQSSSVVVSNSHNVSIAQGERNQSSLQLLAADPETASRSSRKLTNWVTFVLCCAVAASITAFGLTFIEDNRIRGSILVGLAVLGIMLPRNPEYYYRRGLAVSLFGLIGLGASHLMRFAFGAKISGKVQASELDANADVSVFLQLWPSEDKTVAIGLIFAIVVFACLEGLRCWRAPNE